MQTLPVDRQKKLAPPVGLRTLGTAGFGGRLRFLYPDGRGAGNHLHQAASGGGPAAARTRDKNRSLAQSLEENQRMRAYLARIVEGLPCGVLVFDSGMNLRMINPAASRLLDAGSEESSSPEASVPRLLGSLLAALPKEDFSHEQEWVVEGSQGERTLGVTRACFQARESGDDSILILRDLTEAKQLEREREVSRRSQALAEVATLLAHEIRNPLGSLELFAGLLADALADQAELQPWINHVQAGLRSLAATVNNVLHFHSQPSAQLLPVDLAAAGGGDGGIPAPAGAAEGNADRVAGAGSQSFHPRRPLATPAGILQSGAQCFPGDETRRNAVHQRRSAAMVSLVPRLPWPLRTREWASARRIWKRYLSRDSPPNAAARGWVWR